MKTSIRCGTLQPDPFLKETMSSSSPVSPVSMV
jgi:hypothetical protein